MTQIRCNLIVIRSENAERACSFYSALGLSFNKHRHGNGPEHYAAELEGCTFEIYPLAADRPPTTETRIGFAVEEVEVTFSELLRAGGESISKPWLSDWGPRAVVRDLDGHRIELTKAAP